MLKWGINNNVISELYVGEQNIINPWGFETADSSAFFSLEQGVGWRNKKISEEYVCNNKSFLAKVVAQMSEGEWELNVTDQLHNNTINRKAEILTLQDSMFMDFVMRFRFKKEYIEYADIAGRRYYHKNSNVYYQYPVGNVMLKGRGFDINIVVVDSIVPDKMEPVIYVRDSKSEWVIHVRMIPKAWDKEVIKICTAWAGTRPLPQVVSNALLKIDSIRDAIWYRGERRPYQNRVFRRLINPSAFGMVLVPKNSRIMWNVMLEVL